MRKGSRRELNRTANCRHCGAVFPCADPKAAVCQGCRGCKFCGKITRADSRTCQGCRGRALTDKQRQQLARLHAITKANSPSKRPEVREKISRSKLGDLNPARIYREQYAAHIAKYRPGKISKLETIVAAFLPGFAAQCAVGWYKLDFADEARKVAVEIQGCWYHSCQKCFPGSPRHPTQKKNQRNDASRRTYLTARGWRIVEIWEHEIRNVPLEDLRMLCAHRLKEVSNAE